MLSWSKDHNSGLQYMEDIEWLVQHLNARDARSARLVYLDTYNAFAMPDLSIPLSFVWSV